MRVVDTSAWIEWLRDSDISEQVGCSLPSITDWLVPTIAQLELAKWLWRESGEEPADQVVALASKCRIVGLDTKLADASAEISRRFHLTTADAIICATAETYEADLLTCDAHFEGLPNVVYIAKTKIDD